MTAKAEHVGGQRRFVVSAAFLFALAVFEQTARTNGIIFVNTTAVVVDGTDGVCSLPEAIYAANFDDDIAIDPNNPLSLIGTECDAGSGDDVIVLPAGSVFSMTDPFDDAINYLGPTATPLVFTTVTLEANGSRFERSNPLRDFSGANFRAFAVGSASVSLQSGERSGVGNLTIRNAYIKGFTAKGGSGRTGGGGGMGAGGAIYVNGGTLTIENSTFENNGAGGGNGGSAHNSGPGGGGGGLGGDGGPAQGNNAHPPGGDIIGSLGSGPGGGGGGSRGNGGANGGTSPDLIGWAVEKGGGGGGTLSPGRDGFIPNSDDDGKAGFTCGGNGGTFNGDGSPGPCHGGGGGGGGEPQAGTGFLNGVGGDGNYGGGGGGGGYHSSTITAASFGSPGGKGGFGGGGGAGSQDDNGGSSVFGGGGGAGMATPGASGTFGGNGGTIAGGGGAGLGGAIFSDAGTVTIRNSTFAGNYAVRGLPGSGSDPGAQPGRDAGGAIFAVDGALTVLNSTLSGNETTGEGAGIVVYRSTRDGFAASFTLRSTIIANSAPLVRECFYINDVTAAGAGNLIEENFGCPGAIEADPNLGVLQLNAPGMTPTMSIDSLSAAYNAGDDSTCEPFDQRDIPRPQSQHCDIGAYEFIKPSADLTIAKTALGPAIAGQDIAYAINVENNGPTAAQNVTITDVLPAGTTVVAVVGSGGFACSGTGPITCTKASMTAGEIVLLTVTVRVPASVPHGTTITNAVAVGSTTPDPVPANNAASVTTMAVALADLSVTKTGPALPTAGTDLSYAITVVNNGPSNAQDVAVRDTVPAGATFQSFTSPAGWSCTTPAVGTPGPAAIQCSRPTVGSGTTATFALIVRLDASASSGGEVCNTVSVSSPTFDPGNGANSAQSCGIVRTVSDLSLSQTAATSGSAGKGTASFTLAVRNSGPSDSLNVSLVVSSSLFTGPSAPALTVSPNATCSIAGPSVLCSWGVLRSGAVASVVIAVPWRSAVGQVCDQANVSAGTPDPNAINSSSTACIGKKK